MSLYRDHGELLQGHIRQLPVDNFFKRQGYAAALRQGEIESFTYDRGDAMKEL